MHRCCVLDFPLSFHLFCCCRHVWSSREIPLQKSPHASLGGCILPSPSPAKEEARLKSTASVFTPIWIIEPFGLPEVFSLVRYFRTFNSRATIGIAGCWALGESGTCLGVQQWTKPFRILALWSDEPLQVWPCHSWKSNLGGGQFCCCL